MSVDPITPNASDGSNFTRYAYANGNPVKNTDPDGRATSNMFSPDGTRANGDPIVADPGEKLLRRTTDAFNIHGVFTHGGHGAPGVIQENFGSATYSQYTNDTYTRFKGATLQPGQDIFSLACNFGTSTRNGPSLAQRIADQNGSKTIGADGYTYFQRSGDIVNITVWSGRGGTGSRGAFQTFKPGGNGPVAGSAIERIRVNLASGRVTLYGTHTVGTRIRPRQEFEVKLK